MTRFPAFIAALLLAAAAVRAEAPFDPFAAAGIEQTPGARVPLHLTVRDHQGRTTTLGDLAGPGPILLAPVLHECPNICGVTLGGLADAVAAQPYRPGSDFTLIAFGIDPAETPADAAGARAKLMSGQNSAALAEGFHAVTAPEATVRAVTDALGYRYAFDPRIGQYAHVAATAVLTPDGTLARWIYGIAPQPTDLRLALTEAGEGRIGGLAERLLLLCYQYDPQTGRYNALVWWVLRVAGSLTVLVIGAFVGISLLRERRGSEGPQP